MPEIKIKHVVSFSSEDKVHKAENLIKPENYRKWKCATPGEKSATVVLQFEKATQIHSIDIGNESSAFVEVLVGRSSDSVNDYQVLLVASSFMSPLESRNGTHTNRVRMFDNEKLSQTTKNEKWDCIQVVCTQPFNKNISYGLSFIKFHSPPEKIDELPRKPEGEKASVKLGAFKLKDEDDEDSSPPVGSWFGKHKTETSESSSNSAANKTAPSYATAVLASSNNTASRPSVLNTTQKRRIVYESDDESQEPPTKKTPPAVINKEHIVYKDVLRDTPETKKKPEVTNDSNKEAPSSKPVNTKKAPVTPARTPTGNDKSYKTFITTPETKKKPEVTNDSNKEASSSKPVNTKKAPVTPARTPTASKQKTQFDKIMEGVVFVLSGFVNPLRSELRDKALEMGAKYRPDWDKSCTHLVCAFTNTPKYEQVKKLKGRIVTKEWILDCYKKKDQLPWRKYLIDRLSKDDDSSEESDYTEESSSEFSEEEFEDSEDEWKDESKKKKKTLTIYQRKRNKKADSPKKKDSSTPRNTATSDSKNSTTPTRKTVSPAKKNDLGTPKRKTETNISTSATKQSSRSHSETVSDASQSPTLLPDKEESETEDEDALQDYAANTDVEDDSGGNTEDEIRKVEMEEQRKKAKHSKVNGVKADSEVMEKPDVSNLPFPELPNLFKQKKFFLFGDFSSSKFHDLQRYITAYNGVLEDYMNDKIKYVITDKKWDQNFDDALSENEDLIFVKPLWIYKCHEAGKLMPYQPYIVTPET